MMGSLPEIPDFVRSMLPKSRKAGALLWLGLLAVVAVALLISNATSGGETGQFASVPRGTVSATSNPIPKPDQQSAFNAPPVAGADYAGSLILNATGSQLESWNETSTFCRDESWEIPDGSISTDSSGDTLLTTTGKPGSCVALLSPGTYSSAVIEAYIYFPPFPGKPGIIANWTSFWLSGQDWPTNGELDAVEAGPTSGTSSVTWHWGKVNSPLSVSTSDGSLPIEGPDVKPGWHVVDIVYTKGFFAVYYDGKKYTSLSNATINGSPLQLYITTGVTPNESVVNQTTGGPPVNSDGSPAQMAVKYVKVWSFK